MLNAQRLEDIDYLLIGHITRDIHPSGERLGGSVAYAALTAKAFGLRPGILTAYDDEIPLGPLDGIPIVNVGAEESTSFTNLYNEQGRSQRVHQLAPPLDYHQIPEKWRQAPIVHLAPVLGEVAPRMASYFNEATLGVTPQGWLRELEADGRVRPAEWPEADFVLSQADAAVVSREDLPDHPNLIEKMAAIAPLLALTQGAEGSEIFFQGEVHKLEAPPSAQIDPTGAGDIFAAAFFIRIHFGDEALTAAKAATQLASKSVEREGLAGAPTQDEILDLIREAF